MCGVGLSCRKRGRRSCRVRDWCTPAANAQLIIQKFLCTSYLHEARRRDAQGSRSVAPSCNRCWRERRCNHILRRDYSDPYIRCAQATRFRHRATYNEVGGRRRHGRIRARACCKTAQPDKNPLDHLHFAAQLPLEGWRARGNASAMAVWAKSRVVPPSAVHRWARVAVFTRTPVHRHNGAAQIALLKHRRVLAAEWQLSTRSGHSATGDCPPVELAEQDRR